MKPATFEYRRADSKDEALSLLAEFGDEASVLAGGQSLVPLLNLRLARPEVIVDIGRLTELKSTSWAGDVLRLGSLTGPRMCCRMTGSPLEAAVLRDAVELIAHPQIRARTTIGGNVAHGDPAAEIPTLLTAMGGRVQLESRSTGSRLVQAEDFFVDMFRTARRSDEIVTGVAVPAHEDYRWRFTEVARRPGDYAMVALCLGVRLDDSGGVLDAHAAFAGCGSRPVRVPEVESCLIGSGLRPDLAVQAASEARAALEPRADIHATAEYRRHLAGLLVNRSVVSILEDRL